MKRGPNREKQKKEELVELKVSVGCSSEESLNVDAEWRVKEKSELLWCRDRPEWTRIKHRCGYANLRRPLFICNCDWLE